MESSDEGSVNGEKMNSDDGGQSEEENDETEDQKQESDNGSVASSPRSPAGSDRAEVSDDDEEVHISNAEESAGSDDEQNSSKEEVRENESSDDEGGGGSDDEKNEDVSMKDDAEDDRDSVQEGSVPEIDIDSGDENNEADAEGNQMLDQSRDSDSENEVDKSDERKSSVIDEDETSPPSSPKNASEDEGTSPVRASSPRSVSECDEEERDLKIDSENEEDNKVDSDNEEDNKVDSDNEEKKRDSDNESEKAESDNEVHKDSDNEGDRKVDSDNEENDKEMDDDASPTKEVDESAALKNDSDAEGDEHDHGKKDLIANIFGESDEERDEDDNEEASLARRKKKKVSRIARGLSDSEDEDTEKKTEENEEERHADSDAEVVNENEADAPVDESENQKAAKQVVSDDDSDEDGTRKMREDYISDFDAMMAKKKEESSRRRKRKDVDIINDSDDLIAEIIGQMRQAADEDRVLNKQKKTATKKLKILPLVMSQLKKQDLKMAFLDQGVLNAMADWLAPLPDRSLPNLQIREGMIKQLLEFPGIDQSLLKSSGVGRALMYLFKHPKETKENKERAGKLITEWARPIFNVTTDYHSLTKEEREQRDFDHVPTKKRKQREENMESEETPEKKDIEKALNDSDKKLRPGDKGWIGRARVPLPSNRDYVVRPKWNVDMEFGRAPSKKPLNRFEKHMRTLQEKKRNSKGQRAVTISIEGRKMAI